MKNWKYNFILVLYMETVSRELDIVKGVKLTPKCKYVKYSSEDSIN